MGFGALDVIPRCSFPKTVAVADVVPRRQLIRIYSWQTCLADPQQILFAIVVACRWMAPFRILSTKEHYHVQSDL